jgi:heptosyltransferase-2
MTLHPKRLLVRGVNWLGDAVMTTPALLRLRERFPNAHIALLTPQKLRDLWLRHPAVDEVISFATGEDLFSVSRKIRAQKFDLGLVLPNSPRSALEIWLARIPQRIGYARPWRNWLLTQAIPTSPGHVQMQKRSAAEIRRLIDAPSANADHAPNITQPGAVHHIHQYLHLAATLGATQEPLPPHLFITPEAVEAVRKKFELAGTGQPTFGLNPGAEYGPAKRWPYERFVAAAVELQRRTNCRWLLFGGNADAELAGQISTQITQRATRSADALNLAGKTSLLELMALLKLCRVLLTNDSGPMHVAAALGTPVVVPFGSTSPKMTGPGLPGDPRHRLLQSDAPCSPCFLRECPIDFRCMTGITVERVVEAMMDAAKMRL